MSGKPSIWTICSTCSEKPLYPPLSDCCHDEVLRCTGVLCGSLACSYTKLLKEIQK